ncbi:MAG: FecR domain-containing protein [Kofleriaceae bacterium]
MNLRDRVPVVPLDSERWRHLEQRVVARVGEALAQPQPRRWGRLVAVAGLAAAAATVAVVASQVTGPTPRPAPARPLSVTAAAAGAHVDLGDAVIDAPPGTRFEVTRPDGAIRVALATGVVSLEVAPRGDRPPLWVVADDVTVRVVGTAFTVSRTPAVAVTVSHGVVQVERGGAAVAVRAGQGWTTDGGVVAMVAVPGPVPAGALAVVTPGAGTTGAAPSATDGALHVGPAIAFDALTARHRPAGPGEAGAAAAASPTDRKRPPPRTDQPRPARPARPPAQPGDDLRAALAALPVAAAPPAPADDGDVIGSFQRASVTNRGAAAAAATWGLARAQWSAGRSADALRSLDGYLRRFPSGAELDDVLWLRLRLRCRASFDDACRAAAHTFVTRAADGPKRALALRVTQTR